MIGTAWAGCQLLVQTIVIKVEKQEVTSMKWTDHLVVSHYRWVGEKSQASRKAFPSQGPEGIEMYTVVLVTLSRT